MSNNLAYNIINNPYQALESLLQIHDESDKLKKSLLYGPLIVQNLNPEYVMSFLKNRLSNNFSIIDSLIIHKFISDQKDKLFNQKSITNRVNFGKMLNSFDITQLDFRKANTLNRFYDVMDSYKKSTEESVMTATSPIEPYQGVIKNPQLISKIEKSNISKVNNIHSISEVMKLDNNTLKSFMEEYATLYGYKLLENEVIPVSTLEQFETALDNFNNTNNEILRYYLIGYKCLNKNSEAIENFTNLYLSNTLLSQDPKDLLTLMESATCEEVINIDTIMKSNKLLDDYMYEIFKSNDITKKELSGYPIEKLRNFLRSTFRYRPNKQLASMFLSQNKEIDNFIMEIDDVPIAEVQDKYLVAPVTDYAVNNKPVLIVMDRKGEINTYNSMIDIMTN